MVPAWIQGGNSIKKLGWYAIINSKNGNRTLGINHPLAIQLGPHWAILHYVRWCSISQIQKKKNKKTQLSLPFICWHVAVWTGSLWNSSRCWDSSQRWNQTASGRDNQAINIFLIKLILIKILKTLEILIQSIRSLHTAPFSEGRNPIEN